MREEFAELSPVRRRSLFLRCSSASRRRRFPGRGVRSHWYRESGADGVHRFGGEEQGASGVVELS